jgi:hypothetical protein
MADESINIQIKSSQPSWNKPYENRIIKAFNNQTMKMIAIFNV